MAEGYTIKSIDEFEEMEGSGGATWRLARKSLGAESFGFNVVDIEPGGQIPAHDHSGDDQEEVFIILEGQGTIVTGDEEHDAPAGTFCRYAPDVPRTIRNDSEAPVRALLIGVPVKSGYQPMSWG
jgi:quercetin dioxygenase-like cupin family protein